MKHLWLILFAVPLFAQNTGDKDSYNVPLRIGLRLGLGEQQYIDLNSTNSIVNIAQRCFIQKITNNHPTMWVSLL